MKKMKISRYLIYAIITGILFIVLMAVFGFFLVRLDESDIQEIQQRLYDKRKALKIASNS